MLDFVKIKSVNLRNGIEVFPDFIVKKSKDLMIRGKSFYAIWDEESGFWSQSEDVVQKLIDKMISQYVDQNEDKFSRELKIRYLKDFSSNKWVEWQKYCKSLPDNFHELDENVVFENSELCKESYVTKVLPYRMENGSMEAYEEMMSELYDPEEREKIEWAIGSIIKGDSKYLQKFIVLYGPPGSGKSTVLNIIQNMFPGYYSVFDSKALSSASNAFALEAFRSNPLIAIQHDGDLSKIEDNTKLNSIVSHETMMVNEKFKATYATAFKSFLFMGTNKPVKITDAKSGILRRLIDVQPSGRKIPRKRFEELNQQIKFEYGAIAKRCLDTYERLGFDYYDGYIPLSMMSSTNDFFNFMEDNYDFFSDESQDGISLTTAWRRYNEYCEDAKILYPLGKRLFKDELKNYFKEFLERDGNRRSIYYHFRKEKFEYQTKANEEVLEEVGESWLKFDCEESLLDEVLKDYPAQYANKNETPSFNWDRCKTKLSDLDTKKLHYTLGPENLIVMDFDLKNENGEKDFKKNWEAASKFPKTYAELSKGGSGIHLHYWTNLDINTISRMFSPEIEIKLFNGKSSLRRRVSKCNDIPIAKMNSGLPKKEVRKTIEEQQIKSEKSLREMIKRNLRKEIHGATKPSIDFINTILKDAYESGLKYDVRDMRPAIQNFAMNSTHQADYCVRLIGKMKFASEEPSEDKGEYGEEVPIVFYDVEVFPNLFVVVWKKQGAGNKFVKWINPKPEDIEELIKFRIVGFNNRKYDNHMIYARMMGYNEEQIFKLSQRIIADEDKNAFFGEAYNLSYTDIYDFLSPQNKMSLKKWEIKLGIHHQELGLPWDKPVPKELWNKVADYCINDVFATEAVWDANQEDWLARKILAEWADMTPNSTTNQLTTKIIVGNDPHPQSQFVYTDLSTIFPGYRYDSYGIPKEEYDEGAKIVGGKSIYRGEDPSEGGKVSAIPGMYEDVAVLDIGSMHPHSMIVLNIFGDAYTLRFKNIVDARMYIKHGLYDKAKEVLPEKLWRYLDDKSSAKKLSGALKGAINPVYGLTSAKFENKLKDPRNVDNIVAKYGSLFMINLRHEVEDRDWKWVHIKTDSIKIANATPEMIQFVKDYGKQYGFTFEHECTYEKMCLVNESTYIALVGEEDGKKLDKPYWTATGKQFQVPFVFKTLFSKENILFEDICETFSVSTSLYLDMNEKLWDLSFDENGDPISDDDPRKHDYRFVGKVGSFCPIKPGQGGGVLLREKDGKYYAATGTKKPGKGDEVWRWLESEMIINENWKEMIDLSYYNHLVDDAVEAISKFGDFEQFVSSETKENMNWLYVPDGIEAEEIPFDEYTNKPEVA